MGFAVKSLGEDGGGQSDKKTLSVEERECNTVVSIVFRYIKPTSSYHFSVDSGLGLDGFPICEPQLNKCATIMDTTSVLPSISFRRQTGN